MPPIHLRPTKACVYPDTSTLVYAFKAAHGIGDSGDEAILDALRRVAAGANLCLGYTHLMELARGGDRAGADGAVLDELDIVWLAEPQRAELLELRQVLLNHANRRADRPKIPALPSFSSQFEMLTPSTTPDLLRLKNLSEYLRDAASDPVHQRKLAEVAAQGRQWNERFFADRKAASKDGVSQEVLLGRLDGKLHALLVELATQVHDELVSSCASEYLVKRGELVGFPERAEVAAAIPIPSRAPNLMPTVFCLHEMFRNAAAIAARKASITSGYFNKREGDFFDWSHVVGAAYAEGFCCDSRTAEQLGDARAQLGLPGPMILGGSKHELAKKLREFA